MTEQYFKDITTMSSFSDSSEQVSNLQPSVQQVMQRAFIAYMLPLDTSAVLNKKVQRFELPVKEEHVRWVPPQNYHVTLRFLGNSSEQQLSAVAQSLREHLQGFQPFISMTGGIELLPSSNHPRVMSLKVHSGRRMDDLHRICEEIALDHGYQNDTGIFQPHVTLARAGARHGERAFNDLPAPLLRPQKYSLPDRLPGYRLQVGEVALVTSDLQPDGSKFTIVERFPLV